MAEFRIKNKPGDRLIGYKSRSEKPILANVVSLRIIFFIKVHLILLSQGCFCAHLTTPFFLPSPVFPMGFREKVISE